MATTLPSAGNFYYIVNKRSGKYMEVFYGDLKAQANIEQHFGKLGDHQIWKLLNAGNGYFYIVNKKSNLYMEVVNGSLADKANIEQFLGGQGDHQIWRLLDAGNGYFYIVNKKSNKYVDVADASLHDRANIIQCTGNQGDHQKWKFEFIPPPVPPTPPVPTSGEFQVPTNSTTGVEFINKLSKNSSYKFTPFGTWKPKSDFEDFTAAGVNGLPPEYKAPYLAALEPYQQYLKYQNNTYFALLAVNKTTGVVTEVGQETTIVLTPGETLIFVVNDLTIDYTDNTGTLTVNWSAT